MLDDTTTAPEARSRGHRHRLPGVHRCRVGARHLDRQRGRAVHDGRPRHDLAGLRHDRDRDRLRPRAHRRQPHQPGRHARARRLRASSPGRRCPATSPPRSSARSSARPPSSGCSATRPATSGSAWRRTAGISWVQAFTAEFVGTFILVFTIFGVIHRKAAAGFAGVAIGLVVFAAIIPVAPATGASINPARTVGPMLVQQIAGGTVKWDQLPVYLAAELLAGVVAALAYGLHRAHPGRPRRQRGHRPRRPRAVGRPVGHGLTRPTHPRRGTS